jgi:Fur family ferric uptake transcriptional regulator
VAERLAKGPGPSRERRFTRQRRALEEALADAPGFLSAQELYLALRNRGSRVGLTTVYQQLKAMADQGEVDVLRIEDGQALYRRCGTSAHHHHIVCRRCGKTVEVSSRQVERWAQRAAEEAGFSDVEHTVEVFGTCGDCGPGP